MTAFPRNIRLAVRPIERQALIAASKRPLGMARLSVNDECVGAKFHSPNPLIVYYEPIVPHPPWSEYPEEAYAWLCANCRSNLLVYLELLTDHQGDLEWEVRREFGNRIRALAERGWELHRARTVEQASRAT